MTAHAHRLAASNDRPGLCPLTSPPSSGARHAAVTRRAARRAEREALDSACPRSYPPLPAAPTTTTPTTNRDPATDAIRNPGRSIKDSDTPHLDTLTIRTA